ncbi:MAG: hypothetical protein J6S89_00390 [Paludibacteraceae bacterium]|nr:hypothetical protein [Paludibacteraceae bacterium]
MKHSRHHRVNGYSLPFAMFVFIVIIILSGTLIMAAYHNGIILNRILLIERLESNSLSAIHIMLSNPNQYNYGETIRYSLYDEYADSVSLKKEQWGAFDLLQANAYCKNLSKKHSIMVGSYQYDSTSIALMIPDQGKSIALVGNVNISGTCQVPESGFSQPSIEGKNYTGKEIKSIKKKSDTKLPRLTSQLETLKLSYAINQFVNESNNLIQYDQWEKDSLCNSFLSDTLSVLYSKNKIHIGGKTIKGKVIVISESKIVLQSSANISDIICFAPYIMVEDKFSGNLQMYASDSIVISPNCQLKYPSIIGINCKEEPSHITIGKGSQLYGVVFLSSTKAENQASHSILSIQEGACVKGQVYSNEYTEIKGNVWGSVYTNKFILRTQVSIYENTIMDADIDLHKLSKDYVGVDLTEEGTTGGVIKWLY